VCAGRRNIDDTLEFMAEEDIDADVMPLLPS
jgi:hypothetical protein